MKLNRTFGVGLMIGCGFVNTALGEHPRLDPPSPPPCCADGLCYPNPWTWGWYSQHWRRWPCGVEAGIPGVKPPAPLIPGAKTHVIPKAEDEDRRAPAPTTPPTESTSTTTTPAKTGGAGATTTPPTSGGGGAGGGTAPTRSVAPGATGGTSIPESTPRTAPLVPHTPVLPQTAPSEPSVGPQQRVPLMPFEEPTGDSDPPPMPPSFAPPSLDSPSKSKEVARSPSKPNSAKPGSRQPNAMPKASDPPPGLPVKLASR